jgi:hypothetical protein
MGGGKRVGGGGGDGRGEAAAVQQLHWRVAKATDSQGIRWQAQEDGEQPRSPSRWTPVVNNEMWLVCHVRHRDSMVSSWSRARGRGRERKANVGHW